MLLATLTFIGLALTATALCALRLLFRRRAKALYARQRERDAEYDRSLRDSATLAEGGNLAKPWVRWHAPGGPLLQLTDGDTVRLARLDRIMLRLDLITPAQLQQAHFERILQLQDDIGRALGNGGRG